MLNKAILIGRLTRDPELRHTQGGTAVASFTLAIDRDRASRDGQRETDFIDCVAWGKQAEFVCQWFTKGMLAIVCGRIQSRSWEDKNGSKRKSVEVICAEVSFGETKKAREAQGHSAPQGYQGAPRNPADVGPADFTELTGEDVDDGDVPF